MPNDHFPNDQSYPVDAANYARRNSADGVLEAVWKGGPIQILTLTELLSLLDEKTNFPHHIAVEIKTGALLKTIDNEVDARETIQRLRAAPPKRP